MKFRSHLAAYALASVAVAGAAGAAETGETIVLESHALRADDAAAKAAQPVHRASPVVFEMKAKLREDGSVVMYCDDASHADEPPHDHDDGREEIR